MSDETKPDTPATTEDLADAALNFGTNLLTTLDLPASVLKNAYKALSRLGSAAIEWPVAFLGGKAVEIRAGTEGRIKIIEAGTDQIIEQMEVPPEYAQIAVSKYIEKIIGEQVNLDKISSVAVNELMKGQSDNSTNQGISESEEKQPVGSQNQNANSSEEKTISDVWLNIFETEARPRSTEEGQFLFGRILAGEIRNPGSYSIRTIKTLGELNQNTAILFKKLCSACVVLGISNNEHIIDIRVPSLGGNAGSNALRKYGLGFDHLNMLNEYDLIISDYNSWCDYKLCTIMNQPNPTFLSFQHQGKSWGLLPSPDQDNTSEFRLSGVALSRIGRELFFIVDQDPMPEYTESLKEYFARQKLQMIEILS